MTSYLQQEKIFCSWSGGKDSVLALHHAIRDGASLEVLFTMLQEDGKRSRSHGLPCSVLNQQAQSLGAELQTCSASWDEYEDLFIEGLQKLRKQGMKYGVFGDIDISRNLEWVQQVCTEASVTPVEPLWKCERDKLLREFIELGFKVTIIVVNREYLSDKFLGRELSFSLIEELVDAGIDPSGEEGEYHTVVTDGPLFNDPVVLPGGEVIEHNQYSFLKIPG